MTLPPFPGVFVTGTDTGVGKTQVGLAVIRELKARGLRVAAMKPIETGVPESGPEDALALWNATDRSAPLEDLCPLQYKLPAAPNIAAQAEGREVDLHRVYDAFPRICEGQDFVWVEGAGGLLVPIRPNLCMADLAQTLKLPIILVARASLGTINHTLLSLSEIKHRRLPLLGVIISHAIGPLTDADHQNLSALKDRLGAELLGELLPLEKGAHPEEGWLDVERVIERRQSLQFDASR